MAKYTKFEQMSSLKGHLVLQGAPLGWALLGCAPLGWAPLGWAPLGWAKG